MVQELSLYEGVFDLLDCGKNTTIRMGRKDVALGRLLLKSETRKIFVNVIMVSYCKLGNVYICDVKNDGFIDHTDMYVRMKRFYPDIETDSEVTVVKFANRPNTLAIK